jgi:DNA-binding transcriptional LysR family regulator
MIVSQVDQVVVEPIDSRRGCSHAGISQLWAAKMQVRNLNWDDLRVLAAVRDTGSFARAGIRLRVDETTIGRRVTRIQKALGVLLFEAADGRRLPTSEGAAILAHVDQMALRVLDIQKSRAMQNGASGRFRISATSALAEEILAPSCSDFLQQNPELSLRFLTSNENVNFDRWEADFAIRLAKPARGNFVISKLANIGLFLCEPAPQKSLALSPVICAYPEELGATPESRFLSKQGLASSARMETGNIKIMRAMIKSGQAIGILPDYLCQDLLADKRYTVTQLPQGREVWLLMQNHLKQDPSARAVVAWLRTTLDKRLA